LKRRGGIEAPRTEKEKLRVCRAEAAAAERSFVKNSPLNLAPVRKFLQLPWRVSKNLEHSASSLRDSKVLVPCEIIAQRFLEFVPYICEKYSTSVLKQSMRKELISH